MTEEKPRIVIDFGGLQIHDCRRDLRVVLIGEPPKGLRSRLREHGFRPHTVKPGTYVRPTNPQAIFNAQAIGREFFPATKETI